MFIANLADRFAAAAFSVVISAGLLAYAIIPASPALIA
ncbi:MAG: enoyl-CoA hydratase [Erythrobacter sp.]